ncbi:10197_t:CDS:2 [Ambispora leptoticha]|uniref:10197_t:CDS:1 n=1 Tax=Ambispora leptoticha TaxID=144679 RepID=A0A9N9GX49_9GLOM|nr:10197_t:CDS:2 [Ambispora leptoticha]
MTFDDIDNQLGGLKPLLAPGSLFLVKDINNNNLNSDAYVSWVCGMAYPKCLQSNTSSLLLPCKSTCENAALFKNITLPKIRKTILGDIQNYNLFLDDLPNPDCNKNISSTSVFGLSEAYNFRYKENTKVCYAAQINSTASAMCYPPLVANSSNSMDELKYCANGCCVPCPQSYALYKKDRLKHWYNATQVVRVMSAIGSLIMLLSYCVLPGKKSHPSILILFTSLAIFLYSSNVLFSIGNAPKIQCHTEIIPSNQDNNPLCGLQASHKVKYEFAALCLIEQQSANSMFFYPIAAFVLPSFFIHVATFVHIAKISTQSYSNNSDSDNSDIEFIPHRTHVLHAVKIQWRALVLAVLLLTTTISYWLFYFISLRKIAGGPQNASLFDWLKCVAYGKGQDFCTKFAAEKIPSLGLLAAAEMSVSLLGIYLLVIFTNRSLWLEWGHWFSKKFRPRNKLKVPSRFFAS